MPTLTAREFRLLDRLAIGARGAAPLARAAGARLARTRGFSTEFDDFRHYQPGDDPRTIDWTIDARLRQLVVRVFRSDARLRTHLLVDCSGSMGIGVPAKLDAAKKMAAALAYVAAGTRDEFGLAVFDQAIREVIAPANGPAQLHRVLGRLDVLKAAGGGATTRALEDYAALVHGPGVAVVISDFFHENDPADGLRRLLHRRLIPAVVHIAAPEFLDVDEEDDVELVDSEDPARPPLVVDRRTIVAYRERVVRLTSALARFCGENALPYVHVDTSVAFERVLETCVPAGLLAART